MSRSNERPNEMADRMTTLVVNGSERQIESGSSLDDLLRQLALDAASGGLAVALNDEVVPRGDWTRCPLDDGDRVEIIRAVQGG